MNRKLVADLFCGAGGTSTGILQACAQIGADVDLLAVNHWITAINTHSMNHPGVRHICESLDALSPRQAVPSLHLDLLAASPECTHHSVAAGGRPKNEQSRATAWHICRWAADLTVENIFIENVQEFQQWGPLAKNGKPLKRRKGETFKAFINALRAMNFTVEWRVQNAADFGDATSRRRLIILARRGAPVVWPEPSHGSESKPWRAAREIIDWELKGLSIFRRKRPLSPNTIRRIIAGLRKFGGESAEPFLVMLSGTNDVRSTNRPWPTVCAGGQKIGLAEPFLVKFHGDHAGRQDEAKRVHSTENPLPTLDTSNRFGLCQPFLTHITHSGNRRQHSVADPVPTITTAHRGELALIEPLLARIDQTGANGICVHPVDGPAPTIDCHGQIGLCQPFIVKYYGAARGGESLNEPLDTITSRDRFMLVEPKTGKAVAELDILFRMLQPHELAAATSFPKDYRFTGTRGDQVKQIGNAVPVNLARAHALAIFS